MQYVWQMLLLISVLAFGGCSVPRAGVLYVAALQRVPLMEGAVREKIEVQPFVGREPWVHWDELPWAAVEVATAQTEQEVTDWYYAKLTSRGWSKPESPDTHPEHGQLIAVRHFSFEGLPIQEEEMWLAFREQNGQRIAVLSLRADYVGAAVGHAVSKPFVELAILSGPSGSIPIWLFVLPMEFGF